MAGLSCDKCDRGGFKNAHALSMHKVRAHGNKKWGPARKRAVPLAARKAVKPNPRPQNHVLREVWSDQNGRILLTDENEEWWVAKKLDI